MSIIKVFGRENDKKIEMTRKVPKLISKTRMLLRLVRHKDRSFSIPNS